MHRIALLLIVGLGCGSPTADDSGLGEKEDGGFHYLTDVEPSTSVFWDCEAERPCQIELKLSSRVTQHSFEDLSVINGRTVALLSLRSRAGDLQERFLKVDDKGRGEITMLQQVHAERHG